MFSQTMCLDMWIFQTHIITRPRWFISWNPLNSHENKWQLLWGYNTSFTSILVSMSRSKKKKIKKKSKHSFFFPNRKNRKRMGKVKKTLFYFWNRRNWKEKEKIKIKLFLYFWNRKNRKKKKCMFNIFKSCLTQI